MYANRRTNCMKYLTALLAKKEYSTKFKVLF